MNVQGLGLVDKGTPSDGEVQNSFLTDFPYGFEDFSALGWDLHDLLYGSISGNELVSNFGSPQIVLN